MNGPTILVRSLSEPTVFDKYGNAWQYHSRSDHHSKVACWGVVFDLMNSSALLRRHVQEGRVGFGINHELRDFQHDRKKDLDVVLCTPAGGRPPSGRTLADLADTYRVVLTETERRELAALPVLRRAPVGAVLLALEAKAAMTAHQRALPRFYDELNSSQATVHGASDQAIAVGLVMVNAAAEYVSNDLNKKNLAADPIVSRHKQPRDAQLVVDKVRQLPRRSKLGDVGYDALGIIVVEAINNGTPFRLIREPPAPQSGDIYGYTSMIDRAANIYATRFKDL